MNTFLIKLALMPLVVAAITMISRKWGNTIGGIVASLPWVAGPIIFFIAVEQGPIFASQTISGVMIGLIGWLTFCLAFAKIGQQYNALVSLLGGYITYMLTGLLLNKFINYLDLFGWTITTLVLMVFTYIIFPKPKLKDGLVLKTLRFDIPLRMLMMTSFVIVITYFAQTLGPAWSGILTPFPIMTAVLAVFTHYSQGIEATILILKGLLIGIIGFMAFMYLLAILLPTTNIATAFLSAISVNLAITFAMKLVVDKWKI
ncbi:MAG: hypothetical protein WAT92_05945 [Saprospiraceae bacterium]